MHPRATKPIEMLSESLNEILMSVKFSMQYRKSCDSEFWQVTKENDGILEFPSNMLLLNHHETFSDIFPFFLICAIKFCISSPTFFSTTLA